MIILQLSRQKLSEESKFKLMEYAWRILGRLTLAKGEVGLALGLADRKMSSINKLLLMA